MEQARAIVAPLYDALNEPELSGNINDTTIAEYFLQSCEAQEERDKKTYDLMIVLCRNVDALVDKTLDECGGNQVVSRVVADLQACMNASMTTHL